MKSMFTKISIFYIDPSFANWGTKTNNKRPTCKPSRQRQDRNMSIQRRMNSVGDSEVYV